MKREFTAKELEMIMRGIRGTVPGLYIPVSRGRRVERTGPHLAVFKSYTEVTGDPNAAERYWERLNETPLNSGLLTLSAINLILALASIDGAAHEALNRTFLREEHLRNFANSKEKGARRPDIEILFSRGGILANIKALVAAGSDEFNERDLDLNLIGDLTLLCNNYVGGTYLKGDPESVNDIELLIEVLPTWELDNPRKVPYALTRVVRMIKGHLSGDDPLVVKLRGDIGLKPSELRYDDLGIDDYIAVIFGIFAHGRSLDFESIFQNPAQAIIEPKTFFSATNFPQAKLEHFINARSLPLRGFRERITESAGWGKDDFLAAIASEQFATDTLAIKEHPFLQLEDDRALILDIQYVSELLIYGLYWRIVNSLERKQRDVFISLWGRLLELYLFDLFSHFYLEGSGIFSKEVAYEGGQIDALLDLGEDVIIFEFKASLLRDGTKNSRDINLFEDEVKRKFIENEKGKPKALRQLAGAAIAIREGAVRTAMKPKHVYPVLVGYEPVLESFFMNTYLQNRFREFVPKKDNEVIVQPITVMSVDELEKLLPYMQAGAVTWPEVLNERFDEDRVSAFSVHQSLYDLCQKKGVGVENNRFLLEGFDAIFADISSRYRGDNDSL